MKVFRWTNRTYGSNSLAVFEVVPATAVVGIGAFVVFGALFAVIAGGQLLGAGLHINQTLNWIFIHTTGAANPGQVVQDCPEGTVSSWWSIGAFLLLAIPFFVAGMVAVVGMPYAVATILLGLLAAPFTRPKKKGEAGAGLGLAMTGAAAFLWCLAALAVTIVIMRIWHGTSHMCNPNP